MFVKKMPPGIIFSFLWTLYYYLVMANQTGRNMMQKYRVLTTLLSVVFFLKIKIESIYITQRDDDTKILYCFSCSLFQVAIAVTGCPSVRRLSVR